MPVVRIDDGCFLGKANSDLSVNFQIFGAFFPTLFGAVSAPSNQI
jgi:hypothetical protein